MGQLKQSQPSFHQLKNMPRGIKKIKSITIEVGEPEKCKECKKSIEQIELEQLEIARDIMLARGIKRIEDIANLISEYKKQIK